MVRLLWIACAFILGTRCGLVISAEPKDVGIVLMHGWGLQQNPPPGRMYPHRKNDALANALRQEGFHVIQEEMPWGPNRIIDASIDAAMREIDGQVEKLRALGAKKMVIAGHSMGTPMALAYAARRDGVAGVIGLAPGHHPELQPAMYPEFFPKQVAKAKEAIAAGKGDEQTRFTAAQCCVFYQDFWTTPRIYLSYFDPDGPGTMAGNAAKVKAGVPVLFVFGKRDVIFKLLEDVKQSYADYVPGRLPANPLHRRVILDADHGQVPGQSIRDVLQWLKDLP